jgi:hypothetical protein
MLRIKLSRGGIDHVAAFRHGERDDADGRVFQRGQQAGTVGWRDEIDHRPGDTGLTDIGFLLDDGGEIILRGEFLAHHLVGRQHACTDNRPVMIEAHVEEIIEIDGEMGAVEIANAEMDNARRERRA